MTTDSPDPTDRTSGPLGALAAAGTSVWLDDLSRVTLTDNSLRDLITDRGVVGVTTNPAIFAKAMSTGTAYDTQLESLRDGDSSAAEAVFAMAVDDVRDACDLFADVNRATDGVDGRVSLEVDPRLARDREATVSQALHLAAAVDRPDALMIKIPATEECLPAVTDVLAAGISVNVTLIFSVARYQQVMKAFIEGIAAARENGHDISRIHSVASFFVSRVDTEIDARLDAAGTPEAAALKGKAGIANARLAYDAFRTGLLENATWQELAAAGAHVQRPLWASTSVKNPEYPDTMYVVELAGPQTVNTMPLDTLTATADHGEVTGDRLTGRRDESWAVFEQLEDAGIELDDVFRVLEDEGVQKFVDAWTELLEAIGERL
ncbi:transaldolase [Corynebacterium bovis]|uniref:transaldolase n=1 Tax=Corynebacterium bovis TaxID=36808 RepID=UPI003139FDD6